MKDKTKGIVFVIWFLLSIAGVCISADSGYTEWALIIFGQIFIVVGVFINIKKWQEDNYLPIFALFPTVGLGCTGYGIHMLIVGEDTLGVIFSVLMLSFFSLTGVLLLCSSIPMLLSANKECTFETVAKCIDVKISYTKTKRGMLKELYNPTYRLWWKGQECILCNHIYTPQKYVIGELYKIHVNPDNIDEFVDTNAEVIHIAMFIIGIILMVISIGLWLIFLLNL